MPKTARAPTPCIDIGGRIVSDLDTRYDGIVRLVGGVGLSPKPTAAGGIHGPREPESFGGFNIVYRVKHAEARFGEWSQFRFELHAMIPEVVHPRWFALDLDELLRQLQLLRATGRYRHETKGLDDTWFKLLLLQLL